MVGSGFMKVLVASTDAEILACFDVMKVLRPHLEAASFVSRVRRQEAQGYRLVFGREEDRVDPKSTTETYAALKVGIDNWRWAGVPFYLRTGKRMPNRVTEIAIQFKLPPLHLFTTVECEGDFCDLVGARPNTLVFRIQPDESIGLSFSTKRLVHRTVPSGEMRIAKKRCWLSGSLLAP